MTEEGQNQPAQDASANGASQQREVEFEHEGKKQKFVPLSDLIAAKKSLQQQIDELKSGSTVEAEKAKKQLSESLDKVAAANAKVTQLEAQLKEGAGSAEELARIKTELESKTKVLTDLETKAVERHRMLISATYRYPMEQLKDKTSAQLDSLEEALKALATARSGSGSYLIGGQGGTGGLTGSPFELAQQAYANKK